MTRYRVHFEPVDVDARDHIEALKIVKEGKCPDIRQFYPIDENGLPIQ